MNSVERTKRQLQVALLIEGCRHSGRIPNLLELASAYSIQADPALINSSIKGWESKGFLIVHRAINGNVSAALRQDFMADALSDVLDFLEAETFNVDWQKEELVTDAPDKSVIVVRDGWKLLSLKKESIELRPVPEAFAASTPIQITNNFSPVNNVSSSVPHSSSYISWSGWVGVIVAIVGILFALWIAGKL